MRKPAIRRVRKKRGNCPPKNNIYMKILKCALSGCVLTVILVLALALTVELPGISVDRPFLVSYNIFGKSS